MTAEQQTIGQLITIPLEGEARIEANLYAPDDADAIVLFAHGSGSSRHSSRNRFVAQVFQDAGFATLLVDLLTNSEKDVDKYTREHRFDIELLAARLVRATDWFLNESDAPEMPIGYFGSSTGAAAALIAEVQRQEVVEAVVSRGGRVDMAEEVLADVKAPTLMIVGGEDDQVLELNKHALQKMTTETSLEVVPGAGHLFEEPGTLDAVADHARSWFNEHLR